MTEIKNNEKSRNWNVFWEKSPDGFNDIMQKSTAFCGQKLISNKIINQSNNILDFGCGPGFLIDIIKNDVNSIIGVDISESYINICKKKYELENNLKFDVVKAYDFSKLSEILTQEKSDTVLILSTLQYYESEKQVSDLINIFKKIAQNQKIRCIIADIIPKNHSFLADVKDLIFYAIQKRFFKTLFKFILYTFNSDYSKYKKKGLLEIDYSFFEKLALEKQFSLTKMPQITIHSKRYSICLEF